VLGKQRHLQKEKENDTAKDVGLALFGASLLSASAAMAQESDFRGRNEVSVQGTGVPHQSSQGGGFGQHSTDTGGFLISYRYHSNRWLAADASYGYARNTQQNFTTP